MHHQLINSSCIILIVFFLCACGSESTPSNTNKASVEPIIVAEQVDFSSSCPNFEDDVSPNSLFSFTIEQIPKNISSTDFSLKVKCDNTEIQGEVTLHETTLRFSPNIDLPKNQNCSIKIQPNSNTITVGFEKTFIVSNSNSNQLIFNEPIELYNDWPSLRPHYIGKDNKNVVIIYSMGPQLYITVSYDNGETFSHTKELSIGVEGNIRFVSAEFSGGELYLVWNILVTNAIGAEVLFTRSSNNLSEFNPPTLVTNPYDSLSAHSSGSLAVKNKDNVYISWDDIYQGNWDRIEHEPLLELHSLNLITLTENASYLAEYKELSGHTAHNAKIIYKNDQLYVAWSDLNKIDGFRPRNASLRLYNYTQGMQEILLPTVDRELKYLDIKALLSANDNSMHIVWSEFPPSATTFLPRYFFSTINTEENISTQRVSLPYNPEIESDFSSINSLGDNTLIWLVNDDHYTKPKNHYLNFYNTISKENQRYPLDILYPRDFEIDGIRDNFRKLHIDNEGIIYLTWERVDDREKEKWYQEHDYTIDGHFPGRHLLFSKGRIGVPCESWEVK